MNAKQFVEHIGITNDYDSKKPSEKIDVVVELIRYYEESYRTRGLLWPLMKLGLKFAPIDAIPNKLLDWNYNGEFVFKSNTLKDAKNAFFEAAQQEIKKQDNLIIGTWGLTTPAKDRKYHSVLDHKSWNIKPLLKGYKLSHKLIKDDITAGKKPTILTYEVTGVRHPSIAKKNIPSFKIEVKISGEWVNEVSGYKWSLL